MRFMSISLFMVSFFSASMASDQLAKTAYLIRNITAKQTKKISNEIKKTGPCEANNQQLIATCSKHGAKNIKGGDKPITIEKIYYLGTFVKKLEEYDNYPNN